MRSPVCSLGQSGMGRISTASSWNTIAGKVFQTMQKGNGGVLLYLCHISYNAQHGEARALHLTHPKGAVGSVSVCFVAKTLLVLYFYFFVTLVSLFLQKHEKTSSTTG